MAAVPAAGVRLWSNTAVKYLVGGPQPPSTLLDKAIHAMLEMARVKRVDPWVLLIAAKAKRDAFFDLYELAGGNLDHFGHCRHWNGLPRYKIVEIKDCGHDSAVYGRFFDLRGVPRIAPCLLAGEQN